MRDVSNIRMNEFEFIKQIAEGVPRVGEGLIKGIDDDAAVIEGPRGTAWLVTTDIFAEGVHFERGWADWKTLGKKALLVNISDIAAMGGAPWFYFVSIGCPKDVSEKDLMDLFDGMKQVAGGNDMILAGGDTTASKNGLFVSITVIGNTPKENVIYRKGARPGDKIFVSGAFGGSAAGLECLKKGLKDKKYSNLIERHLLPEPRLKLAYWLSKNKCASAMIDVSDGLKGDLDHIAEESGVGYKLFAEKVPADEGVKKMADELGLNALELVLAGGEDYELIFTMNKEEEKKFFELSSRDDLGCRVTEIGEVVDDAGVGVILDERGEEVKLAHWGFVHR